MVFSVCLGAWTAVLYVNIHDLISAIANRLAVAARFFDCSHLCGGRLRVNEPTLRSNLIQLYT